ncbi:MAG: DUF1254 domain-containing protein [Oleispira sp.]|nr:DUF1254 domain-containing protein [Oleispira sp.]
MKKYTFRLVATVLCVASASFAIAAPQYAADVPDSVLTPDKVETELLGKLEFHDGAPDKKTVSKIYDYLDTSRGVDAFLNGIPATSVEALLEGFKSVGMKPGELGIVEQLMDARSLFLTPNSTTMYAFTEVNVKNGPVVVEIPPGVLGPVDDAYFRWVTDVGVTGPDKGKGGKYLFVHRDYQGDIPKGYFVAKTSTYKNLMFFRGFIHNGDLKATADGIKSKYRSYPLAEAANPAKQKFHNLSGKKFNTVHANNVDFYKELNAVIQYEPADAFDPEIVGQFAAIGIKKGHEFNPDKRMKKILTDAVAIGNAAARTLSFSPRKKSVFFFEDRQWNSPFAGMSSEFLNNGERVLDDRIFFHYMATGITPAMAKPMVGKGSAYAFAAKDSKGDYLEGNETYKVTMPAPIPAKNFWSFMVYSNQHRSMLETDQKFAGLDSLNPEIKANADGSYTMWFGPKAPKGHESNWIQTMPGKGYSVLLRLYGPLQPWFDKTWKPSDFELVD